MTRICFIEHDGTQHVVDAVVGRSLMQTALDNFVPGIVADCGGGCTCATCHGYIDERWIAKLPKKSADEKTMLECALHVQANSRLTCQIPVTEALEGLIVRLPVSQF